MIDKQNWKSDIKIRKKIALTKGREKGIFREERIKQGKLMYNKSWVSTSLVALESTFNFLPKKPISIMKYKGSNNSIKLSDVPTSFASLVYSHRLCI